VRAAEAREHLGELVLAAGLGFVLGLAGMVWVATGLGDLLSGAQWPRLDVGALAHAVAALPAHLDDPRLAWPRTVRDVAPGPVAFYTAVALLAAGGAAATVVIRRLQIVEALTGREREQFDARWATNRDLTALRSRHRLRSGAAGSGRLALGYRGRHLLRAEAKHALVVFGPPQSGKSAGIAIPALLEWNGPAVASSIKTDLHAATVRRRRALGEALVFDPYGLAPVRANTWSPLRLARTWDGALSTATRMSAAAELDTSNVKGGSYWSAAAEQRLAPLLWAAANTGGGIAAVVRWAYGQGDAELPALLHRRLETASGPVELAEARAAYDAHVAFESLAGETRSSIESTVQMLVRAYRSPRVQASALSSEITPERLLAGAHTLYLIGDSHRAKLLRPIFLTLLQELVDHAYNDATMRGGRLSRPLLLCLDELGNVAPLPNLAEVASTAPSHNIQLVSIFHDVAQARSRYGDQAQTVINSHRARVLLPGVADLETLRYFSDLLGEEARQHGDANRQVQPRDRRPLAPPQQLRQLADGQALLVYGRLPPTKVRLRTYFADRALQKLASGEASTDGRV
jgi:type IV secretion system protein VirD4